jgi:RNA polymerase sigma-70 factor (ECF subfamily)
MTISHANQKLLSWARAGGSAARGSLLECYRPHLNSLARSQIGIRLRSKVDPADLVQETFLNAYRDFARFRGDSEGAFAYWLRRILSAHVTRTLRTYLGTRKRDVRLECDLDAEFDKSSREPVDPGLLSKGDSPIESACRREQAEAVADALGRLPDIYRKVLLLRYMQRFTFPEIAKELHRTVDGVKKIWTRALVQMRRFLAEEVWEGAHTKCRAQQKGPREMCPAGRN